jgi:outer membrane protein assembly factor BamB
MSIRPAYWSLLALSTTFAAAPIIAAEPSYFRDTFGVVGDAAGPAPEQIDSDDAIVWKVPLAPGHSSPCIVGDAIYLNTFDDGKLFTVALDRATGKTRWRQQAPNDRVESYHPTGSPAVATPAADGERVYSFFGSFGMLCYDTAGKLLWKLPMGPFQDEFGSGSSPIVVDGKVLLNQDHDKDNFLICLDGKTGDVVWRTPRDSTRSYATPIVVSAAGKKQVIVAGALQMAAYDLETGKELWTVDGLARIVNTTPAVAGDMLYVATWSPGGDTDARAAMEPWDVALKQWDKDGDQKLTREECDNKDVLDRFFRIDLDQDKHLNQAEWVKYARVFELAKNSVMALKLDGGNAAVPPRLVWQYDKGIPYVPSPLVYRGVLYLIKDGGILTSFDAQDGRVLKLGRVRGTGAYLASPIAADGKLYVASDRGVVTVLKADGEWESLASRDFAERIVSTPAIVDGRLYVRTEAALYCLK